MRKIDPQRPVGRRVYVGDSQGVDVPMREIPLEAPNPPVRLYDTSGPHGDPAVQVDLECGLPTQRSAWSGRSCQRRGPRIVFWLRLATNPAIIFSLRFRCRGHCNMCFAGRRFYRFTFSSPLA